jgi:hypothetical protein
VNRFVKIMAEKPIVDIGKVFKDKDGAYRIYVGKQIANAASFENKEKVRVDFYPKEDKMIIRKITKL